EGTGDLSPPLASQNSHSGGHMPNRMIQVVVESRAKPSTNPVANTRLHDARCSHRQNRYPAPKPNDAAAQSGVISSPWARMFGSKHHSVSETSPAKLVLQRSRDQRKQNSPPIRLIGMQAQRAIVNNQIDRSPLAAMKSSPIENSGRAPGES